MGISVVAEGVETRQQADLLKKRGCRLGYGFLYSKAVPAHIMSPAAGVFRDPDR
ncbi:EAL domain-containing protein [Neorhizobium galegae]|uniref:EAL domain-containing protein n=1 Tax=Neorhizobium galegae TaxID=399 RepID=A0A6A1THW1_NEOGA|nr:EAL domain-containing protein [Neorhizobium galegae]